MTTCYDLPRREIVARAIRFQTPPRLPFDLPEPYGTDIAWTGAFNRLRQRKRRKTGSDPQWAH